VKTLNPEHIDQVLNVAEALCDGTDVSASTLLLAAAAEHARSMGMAVRITYEQHLTKPADAETAASDQPAEIALPAPGDIDARFDTGGDS
jgi:hypothetical protein